MAKVSIIIPIYNVEKYVRKTIDSAINQTEKDIEIILVDDGSTDMSGKICDEYAQKDKRIKVIHKVNGGLSSARNAGIKVANSEYIMLLDGDDFLNVHAVSILNKTITKYPSDFVQLFDEMKKHTIIGESILKNVGIYQNEELVQLAMHICRWHHERYDGRGYPDGLKGEEIPIEVQVVSIADVYDALVSERVYKKAYSHKKAVEMILNGECGQFNPLLLECLQDIQDRIDEEFQNVENQSEEENQERKVHDQIMETTVLG